MSHNSNKYLKFAQFCPHYKDIRYLMYLKDHKQEELIFVYLLYLLPYSIIIKNIMTETKHHILENRQHIRKMKEMKQTYHITVNDSVLGPKRWEFHITIFIIICFAVQFLLYSLLDHMGKFHNPYLEDYMPDITLIITMVAICVYYIRREKRTKGVMELEIHFRDDSMSIIVNGKEYSVKYSAITEICQIMVFDRMHTEKGCYRMKIKCRGRSNLTFETTQQEYDARLDFEQTELFIFYQACKKAGLPCC